MLRRFSLRHSSFLPSSFPRLAFFSLAAVIAVGLLSNAIIPALAQNNKPQHKNEKADAASDVARGKYIVEGVAMCSQCHTPVDSNGNPERDRWLQGGPEPYVSATPTSDWPLRAPRIGGTPPADDTDMVKLLTTGIWTTGEHLRRPMPQFRMSVSDAQAVVAYLKSLMPPQ